MFTTTLLAAASIAASTVAAPADDPLAASFARMLAHKPTAGLVARPAEPADPLDEAIVVALRRADAKRYLAVADAPPQGAASR